MDALATPEQFAGYLQRDLDRYTAELALAGASGMVRHYCGWAISRTAEDTFTLDGDGSTLLNLPTLRLNAVIAVVCEGVTLEPDSHYTWRVSGQLRHAGWWPVGFRNVVATVDHGHDPVPDEVQLVTFAVAARLYTNPEGLASKNVGGVGRSFTALTELEMAQVSGYQLP